MRKLSWELEDTNAELILAPALTNIAGPRVHTHPVAGLPLIHVDRPTYRGANQILKKSFDIVGSLFLIVLFSPVLLGFAIAIKLTSKGPVFFRQDRVGINGEIFRMIKFRSMVVDAESRLEKLQDENRDAGNVVLFKMKNDPRITKIGKFIRRFSIDELPQLFNVVKGDMSLVGPRPPLKAETDLYGVEARRRLLVKPGHDRSVAGVRTLGSDLGRHCPSRCLLRRELVHHRRHGDHLEDREGGRFLRRRLLIDRRPRSATTQRLCCRRAGGRGSRRPPHHSRRKARIGPTLCKGVRVSSRARHGRRRLRRTPEGGRSAVCTSIRLTSVPHGACLRRGRRPQLGRLLHPGHLRGRGR